MTNGPEKKGAWKKRRFKFRRHDYEEEEEVGIVEEEGKKVTERVLERNFSGVKEKKERRRRGQTDGRAGI